MHTCSLCSAPHTDPNPTPHKHAHTTRTQGDILAFRQFYHDFRKHHLPPLMPPLLHASATTSAAEAHLLESIFSSAPGAK